MAAEGLKSESHRVWGTGLKRAPGAEQVCAVQCLPPPLTMAARITESVCFVHGGEYIISAKFPDPISYPSTSLVLRLRTLVLYAPHSPWSTFPLENTGSATVRGRSILKTGIWGWIHQKLSSFCLYACLYYWTTNFAGKFNINFFLKMGNSQTKCSVVYQRTCQCWRRTERCRPTYP